jgi:nucleolar protein 56
MKALIIQFSFGIFALNEEGALIDKLLFSKKPQIAAKTILKLEAGKIPEDLEPMILRVKAADYDTFAFENAIIANAAQKLRLNVEILAKPSELRSRSEQMALETGFAKDQAELVLWTRNVNMEVAKLRVKSAVEQRDLVVAQAIQTLDDLDRTANLFMGRLREWYGIHFPELDRLIEKHETYARLVLNIGTRENFTLENLEKEDLPKAKVDATAEMAEKSMGADFSEVDLAEVKALSKNILETYELRGKMENYLEKTMDEVAPNVKSLVGSLLGARLISIAGNLRNLAMRPASTIQVLGAEKALFRSLKTGARPPKHGLIFQAALLHDAKRWQRGKIARALAGKLAIAARADAFGGNYVGDRLKADLNRRIEEIKEKYREPPPPKEKPPQERRERRDFREHRPDRGGGRGRDRRRKGGKWRKDKRARQG